MADSQPSVQSRDEGETYPAGPCTITARALGSQSGSPFELAPGQATTDDDVHHKMNETLTALEGEIEFNVAGEEFLRPAGAVAYVPSRVHYGFSNPGPEPPPVLMLFTPSGNQHEYFRELERLFAAPKLDSVALFALQKRYDEQLVSPEGE